MSWDLGGAGVGTGSGSPEAERGARALRDRNQGPPPEPSRRPGCLRGGLALVAVFALLVLGLYLLGQLAGPAV